MAAVPDYVTSDELAAEVTRLRERVAELEAQLASLKAKPPAKATTNPKR